jgi:hypothetical protein
VPLLVIQITCICAFYDHLLPHIGTSIVDGNGYGLDFVAAFLLRGVREQRGQQTLTVSLLHYLFLQSESVRSASDREDGGVNQITKGCFRSATTRNTAA